ncbi:MAG: AAA family ATPase [Meiothermus silvanus]|nr:AAA family ATPase [Allomeiothermus silvanus]
MGLKRVSPTAAAPITWAWEGLIPKGFVSLVAALPGVGKTAVLSALCWQATRPGGGELLGRRVAPGGVLYVDFDSATGDGRALAGWFERHQAAYPDGDRNKIALLEPDGDTYGLGEAELGQVAAQAKEIGAGLIVLDSFMACFPLDSVKSHAVMPVFSALRGLALDTGAAVVVIDHLPKTMPGEVAGARGPLGSVAKTAQARAVHILTRVPPREVAGRNVLRLETHKNSFAAIGEPFGLELAFDGEALRVIPADLPDGSTPRLERAKTAVLTRLGGGAVVPKAELVKAIVEAANLHSKRAEAYLSKLADELGLLKVTLPGRGAPVAYRLPEAEPLPGEPPTPAEPEEALWF